MIIFAYKQYLKFWAEISVVKTNNTIAINAFLIKRLLIIDIEL